MKPITLAIANGHRLFRKLLVEFLSRQENIKINFESNDALELLHQLKKENVDIILLDILTTKLNSIDATAIIRNEFPNVKVIIVAQCSDLTAGSSMWDLDIYGYISRIDDPKNLLQAIMAASEDRVHRNRLFTEALYLQKERSLKKKGASPANDLNEREKQIIQLLWEDKNDQEIARTVFLSVSSVEKIKREFKEKLDVKSLAGLFNFALKHGIISLVH